VTSPVIRFPAGPVVLLGASYAKGWSLGVPGIPILNKGVEGQQTFELLERFDRDVVAAAPRAVIVWGFINDVFRAPAGGTDAALTRARDSLSRIVARAREEGIEPILATEVTARPRDNTWSEVVSGWIGRMRGKDAYQDTINRHVLAINQWIRDQARSQRLLLLDLQPVVSDPSTNRRRKEFATPDGSHVSAAGYEALTAYAVPILTKHFAPAAPGR
jgi:lysophospholipase L1-like esterase